MDILERSGAKGRQVLDKIETDSLAEDYRGLRRSSDGDVGDGGPLTQTVSARSDYTSGPESPSPTGGLSPDETMMGEMRSPESDALDSPDASDDEDVERLQSRGLATGS